MRRIPVWFSLRPFKRLLENQYKRVISAAAQEIPEGSRYISLETQRTDLKGRKVRRVALVDDQSHTLLDLSVDLEAKEETTSEGQSSDSRDGIVSIKQALDTVRSHLTSDTFLVSLSSHGATSLLGLKEGIDFRSHVNLVDAFTVRCKHCKYTKIPSQKVLKTMAEGVLNVNTNGVSNKAVDAAMLSLRMFKHYLKIKDDSQAWESMTHQLLRGESSTTTDADPVVEEQVKEVKTRSKKSRSYRFLDNPSSEERLKNSGGKSSTKGRDGGNDAIRDKGPPVERPVYVFSGENTRLKDRQRLVQVSVIDEHRRVIVNARIKSKKTKPSEESKSESDREPEEPTSEETKPKRMSLYDATRRIKSRLPKNAVIVGMGIGREIRAFVLRHTRHYHSAIELAKIFGDFICPVCHHRSSYSMEHLSAALLGTPQSDKRPNQTLDLAKRSLKIYKKYLEVKKDPTAMKQLKDRLAQTPKPVDEKEELPDGNTE